MVRFLPRVGLIVFVNISSSWNFFFLKLDFTQRKKLCEKSKYTQQKMLYEQYKEKIFKLKIHINTC